MGSVAAAAQQNTKLSDHQHYNTMKWFSLVNSAKNHSVAVCRLRLTGKASYCVHTSADMLVRL